VLLGMVGVAGFSFSLPATRLALRDLDPWVVAFGRAAVAAALALVVLRMARAPLPTSGQWRRLAIVAAGVVIGFPLLTSLALHHRTAAHGAIVVGLVPAATAVMAVLRAGERPSAAFWLASAAGTAAVLVFAFVSGAGALRGTDVELLLAVVLVALGYAGLARGGVARIGQIQLVQAPLTLLWSGLLLGERVTLGSVLTAVLVVGCVAATQRAR
jgi:drug/metabolite transporter (DMT)-like permease